MGNFKRERLHRIKRKGVTATFDTNVFFAFRITGSDLTRSEHSQQIQIADSVLIIQTEGVVPLH